MILKNGKRLDGMGDSMPIGSIVEYNGTDIPDGWEILPGDANVYVGPSEPTDGQEVWIQQGKNLISGNSSYWEEGHYTMEDGLKAGYGGERIRFRCLIPVQPNTTYYCNTFKDGYNFVIRAYDKNQCFTYSIGGMDNTGTFTTNSSAYYIGVSIYSPTISGLTYESLLAQLADETIKPFICVSSESDKTYEAYIIKQIHLKRGDIYSPFYTEKEYDSDIYSLDEQKIGQWVTGKPLYRKTVSCGTLPNTTEKQIAHNISNIETIVKIYGIAIKDGYVFPLPFASTEDDANMYIFVNLGNIVIGVGKDRTSFTESYITIEYTKSTD